MIAPKQVLQPLAILSLAAIPRVHGDAGAAANQDRPPNIVVVFTDDQGYGDLSCYGHPTIHTPHIDRLAEDGMKLTQFYVAAPVCTPSRAALLTGCYPKRLGMHDGVVYPQDDHGLHPDEVTIAEVLRTKGYATGCFGKWHLGHRAGLLPTNQGFDTFFGVPYSNDMSRVHRPAEADYPYRLPLMNGEDVLEWEPDQRQLVKRFTQAAVAFIDAHHAEPFFVYLPHSMPHVPLYASEQFEGRSPRGTYGDVIEEIDWSVGELVRALERNELTQHTLILFTSDNGPWIPWKTLGGSAGPLRGGKGTNWEGGQRVPFIASWPATIAPGTVSREITTALDLFPTLAKFAGAELPRDRGLDGHDISPILLGPEGAASPTDQFLYYSTKGELSAIRRGAWKLWLKSGELFQLEQDISELHDLAGEQTALVSELRELALAKDAEITENARPVMRVERTLFDPRREAVESQGR